MSEYDVFISYSSKDKAVADALVHVLEERKIRCWIAPRNILGGVDYADAIVNALQEVAAVVFVYSRNSLDSKWCKSEIDLALKYGKIVVPFKIEDATITPGWNLYLATQHWIDAVPDPEKKFGEIAGTLQTLVAGARTKPCSADSEVVHDRGQPRRCVLVGVNTGKMICAEGRADGQLAANSDVGDGKSELFTLMENDDGSFSLKSEKNGKFVSAVPPPFGNRRLVVNGPKIDAWEKFELRRVANASDVFTLRSLVTGQYVSVDESKGNKLFADRNLADAWEEIRIRFA